MCTVIVIFHQVSLLEGIECEALSKSIQFQDELAFTGRSIFCGYLANETATKMKFKKFDKSYMSGYQGAKYKRLVFIAKRLEPLIVVASGGKNAISKIDLDF